MRALLDVNVLIALLDADHVHHAIATDWLSRDIQQGWASCPITQNGCIRIMSQPAYPGGFSPKAVATRLAEAAAGPEHAFWPDDVNLLETGTLDWHRVLGHRQITDAYLLALAIRQGGRFVTFDRRLDPASVAGAATGHLHVLVGQSRAK